jgi:hypothetical protein
LSRRTATRLAWPALAFAVALQLGAVVFAYLARGTHVEGQPGPFGTAVATIPQLAFSAVGALVASRRPANPIGWILCAVGLLLSVASFAQSYAIYALFANQGALPAGSLMAGLSTWLFPIVIINTGPTLFLLFPDGKSLSRRWRPVLVLLVAAVALIVVTQVLKAGPLGEPPFAKVVNPLGIPEARGLVAHLEAAGFWAAAVSIPLTAASLVLRFRRSRGERRLQLKWVAFTGVLFALAFVTGVALQTAGYQEAAQVPILLAFASIPISSGIAILRYRLYDVDVVINRTLVYAALTATLAAAYLGSVLLLQLALDPVTSGSSLAVAVSTLAVAALFRPARARIQAIVDRRFYRHKYDAARTLEEFSARMREQVDLEALGGDLREVVRETMQPAHVSLWLRTPEART